MKTWFQNRRMKHKKERNNSNTKAKVKVATNDDVTRNPSDVEKNEEKQSCEQQLLQQDCLYSTTRSLHLWAHKPFRMLFVKDVSVYWIVISLSWDVLLYNYWKENVMNKMERKFLKKHLKMFCVQNCTTLASLASADIFPGGGQLRHFAYILFRFLTMQCKWIFTKHFTLSTLQRKCPKLRQQSKNALRWQQSSGILR